MKKEGRKKNERRKKSSAHKKKIPVKTKLKTKITQKKVHQVKDKIKKKPNIKPQKHITKSYPELEKLFQQIHNTASQQKDKKALKKLDKYKKIISKKVVEYHKDPLKIKELTKEISKGLKFLNVINLHLKAEHSKTINAERKKHEIEKKKVEEQEKKRNIEELFSPASSKTSTSGKPAFIFLTIFLNSLLNSL